MGVFLLNFLCIMLGGYFCNALVSVVVPVKKPWLTAFVPTMIAMAIWTVNHFMLPESLAVLDLMIHVVGCGVLLLFVPSGYRFWGGLTRMVLILVQYSVEFLLAIIALPLGQRFGLTAEEMTAPGSPVSILMSLLCSCLGIGAMYLGARLLKKLYRPVSFNPWLPLFAAVPVSQVVLVDLCLRVAYPTGQYQGISANLAVGILLSIAADAAVIIGVIKYRQAQQLKAQVQLAEEQINVQTSYYRQLQDNILFVNQIRHDLTNQLQAAYRLLENGQTEQVRSQLDVLQDSICSRIGPAYCANLMVDAVLTEKQRVCREKGIRLRAAVELPAQLPIENAHLCSVFSNLLDNSIQGAAESGMQEPVIELRATIRGQYLSIHCSNPAVTTKKKPSKDPLRKHGLGLGILERLAKRYNGSVQTGMENGVFETVLILQCIT